MVFLTTRSQNHDKEIALCLNTCRWTGFFGILPHETCIQCTGERQRSRIHRMGRIYREADAQFSFTGCCRDGHDVCNKCQISEPSHKTGNDPAKPELMR